MYVFRSIICYDGTCYFGWQKTKMGPSLQEAIELALFQTTQEISIPESASRTDRGVHAEAQVISFSLTKPWDPYQLTKALNAHLSKDIRILETQQAPSHFHPTLQAKGKEYHYRIANTPYLLPFHTLYTWHFHLPLDLSQMEQAAKEFLGLHDFSAFANEKEKNPFCTLHSIHFEKLDHGILQISFTGDRFLYKMVRNLSGALAYVGCGKLKADCIPAILLSKDRKKAAVTAPASGLFLHKVLY